MGNVGLNDFERNLRDRGNTEAHCAGVTKRVSNTLAECRFGFVCDISASRVQSFLAELKKTGLAQQTVNHYLRAIKQFSRWLMRDHRANEDRLTHLEGGNVKVDRRIERREVSTEEIEWLLANTLSGPSRLGLSGQQRFHLYVTALGTGLRASELASLTPAHFALDADPPTVRIDAQDEKARRGDVLPLPPDVVELLSPWLETVSLDERLWPGTWAKNKCASKFMKQDLESARAAWIDDAKTEAERRDREQSDFLCYRNHDGKQADFHALRHTYLSRLGRSGASLRTAMDLGRHTTPQMAMRYQKAQIHDLVAAVESLPRLPLPSTQHETEGLKATGTDGISGGTGVSPPRNADPSDGRLGILRPDETLGGLED
jgi:integrase